MNMNPMRAICAAGAMAWLAAAGHADPATGTWRTQPDDNGNFGLVEMATCGAALCGTLGKSYDSAGNVLDSPNTGRRIVWDMQPRGGGSYGGGKIWAPDRDKTYNSRMTLDGDRLKVEGCVLGICRGQTWTRASGS